MRAAFNEAVGVDDPQRIAGALEGPDLEQDRLVPPHLQAVELHHLLAARSWVEDGDLDLANQYASRQWREFSDRAVPTSGTLVLGPTSIMIG